MLFRRAYLSDLGIVTDLDIVTTGPASRIEGLLSGRPASHTAHLLEEFLS